VSGATISQKLRTGGIPLPSCLPPTVLSKEGVKTPTEGGASFQAPGDEINRMVVFADRVEARERRLEK